MTRKSRVRADKVRELRAFFDDYQGRPKTKKLFYLYRAIQKGSILGEYSQAEIGFALYPHEPILERVLRCVHKLHQNLRKWKINRSQAPFPTKDLEGHIIMIHKDRRTYEDDQKRYEGEIDGCQANDRKFRKMTNLNKQQLEAQAKADEIAIENQDINRFRGGAGSGRKRRRKP